MYHGFSRFCCSTVVVWSVFGWVLCFGFCGLFMVKIVRFVILGLLLDRLFGFRYWYM